MSKPVRGISLRGRSLRPQALAR